MLLIACLLFAGVTACDKTDDLGGDGQSAGTVKDADGFEYNTVKIGTQVWTVDNLKTTKYNDGSSIPNVTDSEEWSKLTTEAYCNYDNDENNVTIYGRLYNWYAVNSGKLAPAGWHVASDDDWADLENYLIAKGYNYDGTKKEDKIAKSLSDKTNWAISDETGTPGATPENNNSTGFSALPGGGRNGIDGYFIGIGEYAHWWGSTESDGSTAYHRILSYSYEGMLRNTYDKKFGFSVRLVKD